jgi:hypothetical protein
VIRYKSDLRDGQQDIVTALYQNDEKICVLRPGGGKTIAVLTAIEELIRSGVIRHALVTAPKRVARVVWPDELQSWDHVRQLRHAVLSEGPVERGARLVTAVDRDLTIFGHDIIGSMLHDLNAFPPDHPLFDLLVIDEISRFRNPRGERYKVLSKHIHRWKMVWGLSGTLRPSSTLDLFAPVRLVSRGKLWGRSFYQWQKERFYPTDFNGYNWAPQPGAEERINAEIAPLVVTAEVPKLPEPSIILDRVELPEAARAKYRMMERKLFANIRNNNGEVETVVADSRAIAVGKLGQIANGFVYDEDDTHRLHEAKREWLQDLIENSIAPTLLIYEYKEDFKMLRELLGDDMPYLGAGVSDRRAETNIKAWNAGKLPFMALHPASGGHGLNLQHGGADMAWLSPCWDSELWDQTISRLHRSGQTQQVVVRVCVSNNTIDDMKLDRVRNKLTAQQAFERYLSAHQKVGT